MPYIGKYKPERDEFYKLSRSKVESFLNCKRCFYLDRRLGIKPPPGFPFNLNSAVDNLLKNEFDYYRNEEVAHPYIKELGLNAIPFSHPDLDKWRHNFSGLQYNHEEYKFHLFGAVDDLWIDLDTNELIVVDYKSTSKNGEVSLDADWQIGYKRQMEFYQYLLSKNGYKVSNTGYFVYCNGIKNKDSFNEILEFKISLIPYIGNYNWVEKTLNDIKETLESDIIPEYSENCEYCNYSIKLKSL